MNRDGGCGVVGVRMEWQPIETAPKDGTRVLVHEPGMEPEIAHWSGGVWWIGQSDDFQFPGGITHWMPLPEPPTP